MKTKEQILEWIKNQDWYNSFITNVVTYKKTTPEEYLNHNYLNYKPEWFISGAFSWSKSKEGFEYWGEINAEYLKWLKGE